MVYGWLAAAFKGPARKARKTVWRRQVDAKLLRNSATGRTCARDESCRGKSGGCKTPVVLGSSSKWELRNVRRGPRLGFMPRYYFDYHEPSGVIPDEVGCDLPGMDAVRKLALIALGDATRDFTAGGRTGRIALEVREERGPVLTVFAIIGVPTEGTESERPVAPSDAAVIVPRGH